MRGARTLPQTRQAVVARLDGRPLDRSALAAVQNLHRAAAAVRHHLEQTVLREADLSWTAFTVLALLWVHGPSESRDVAVEVGVSRGTLSGVATTLERRRLLRRRPHPADGRLVVLAATPSARHLMTTLFPQVNAEESAAVGCLDPVEQDELTAMLRRILGGLPSPA